MGLSVDIDHRLGDFHLRTAFACKGKLTALFGPSGSGKTSVVNAIAGLLNPDRAHIVIDGVTLVDTQAGMRTPTHKREIGYVFQEARLFPHMNVRQNLLYARWFGGRGSRPGASFDAVVEMLGVGHLLRRHPSHLSGGEKQRVAIGRALLSHPRLLLMDEPLASLDEARKQEILPFIERLRDEANVPIVYVSHAIAEVRRLADFVVVMDGGAVVESGAPQTVLRQPVSEEGADIIMLDVLAREKTQTGAVALMTKAGAIIADAENEAWHIRVRARDIVVSVDPPLRTSVPNVLKGELTQITAIGSQCRLTVRVGDALLTTYASEAFVRANDLQTGTTLYLLLTHVSAA